MSDTGDDVLFVEIDYGDGTTEQLEVTDGYTSFHPYPDDEKYEVTVTVLESTSPTLDSLDPATAEWGEGAADVTMHAIGSGFLDGAVIVFNNGDEGTVFVSDTDLTTVVQGSTASGAWTVPVKVRNPDGTETGEQQFTFVDQGGGGNDPTRPDVELEIDDMHATVSLTGGTPNTHYRYAWGDGQNGDITTDNDGAGIIDHTYTDAGTYHGQATDEQGAVVSEADITVPGDSQAWAADAAFDPAAHTVTEVIGYVEDNPDQRDAVLELERQGKDRVTLISHLESM